MKIFKPKGSTLSKKKIEKLSGIVIVMLRPLIVITTNNIANVNKIKYYYIQISPPNKACRTARDGRKYKAAYVQVLPWSSQN